MVSRALIDSATTTPAPSATPQQTIFPFATIVNRSSVGLTLLLGIVSPGVNKIVVVNSHNANGSAAVHTLTSLLPRVRIITSSPFDHSPRSPSVVTRQNAPSLPVTTGGIPVMSLPLNTARSQIYNAVSVRGTLSRKIGTFRPKLLTGTGQNVLCMSRIGLLSSRLMSILLSSTTSN